MNSRITSLFASILLSALASSAFASDSLANNVDKTYRLKDGGTLFVFKDGKMAVAGKVTRIDQSSGHASLEGIFSLLALGLTVSFVAW